MTYLFFILALVLPYFIDEASSDPWKGLDSGDQTARVLLHQFDPSQLKENVNPFYEGVPNLANLKESELIKRAESESHQNQASVLIKSSADNRSKFNIEATSDPLMKSSDLILKNPLEAIGGQSTKSYEVHQEGDRSVHVCEESGERAQETCDEDLRVQVVKRGIRKERRASFRYTKCTSSEKEGHYIPCIPLVHAVGAALLSMRVHGKHQKRNPPVSSDKLLKITVPYKACMTELANHPRNCRDCNTHLPNLNLSDAQIKEIYLEKHPQDQNSILFEDGYFRTYKKGETEYSYQPVIKIIYEEEIHEVLPDEWVSKCGRLEELADLGMCTYGPKICSKGPETRLIDGIPISRPCWQYTYTYNCDHPSQNNCGPLRARGCFQIASSCKEKRGNVCVIYNQTYRCQGNPTIQHGISGGEIPFCLDGSCRNQSWETNEEMLSSISQLSLFKEMQDGFVKGLLFKGEKIHCSKYSLDFKDCCGSEKGWGKDLGLTSCRADEKALSEKRKKGLCHFVGTYCAKKVLGKCIKKISNFCCFTNKLLKVFHEQGRPQIGLGWGEPKEPQCRGFSIDEIQRIDFSKLDLKEIFDEIMGNFRGGITNPKEMGQKIEERMQIIQKSIVPKSKTPPKQREGA
jgi:conjugal transfer mating pair stabilization protein TraN